ncbi:MAG: N-6 DNA methylase [Desulfococcaceae bacterium]
MIQEKLSTLVSTFEMNLQTYKERKEKNESEIRKNYIDPMFELMGWNVRNEGLREYQKEVTAEYSVKDEAGKKKADYCFSLNGTPMFFVEAKDPYINIEANRKVAFQIRSYCWNAKVPVGVLTDFEEFSIYDGRYEPKADDSANVARIRYFKYSDYKDKWEELTGLFSKKAVASGSLSDWISTVKIKKGVLPVDEVFLKDMESWREMMAVNIALKNPSLSRKEINFAVQRTIDRIVFLRICEDRGTEPYEEIKKLTDAGNIYSGLVKLFRAADKRYNSGIFCFEKEKGRTEGVDTLTPNLKIDDGILRKVIERLYYPSPYNFAVMPADILGHIYERFLGKVIQIDSDRVVSVEEKPEVRKAGGVYYTPTYIVDYIVKNTIEKLIEGKTPVQAEKMKFLDPACGSGSFLIQAYQHLLNWHLKWYVTDNAEKHLKGKKPVLVKDRNGNIRLSIETRKKILLNNIFGVDIDFQAVEVSKLSLLLKVLEGEDDFTMQQLGLFKERALPDLGKNIKCGNSLIGPDFYENVQMNLLDEEEIYRINAFDWESEFPDIMKADGFDAVIGNPPYVFTREKGVAECDKNYFYSHYKFSQYQINTFILFIEKGFNLLKCKSSFGFIIPNNWLTIDSNSDLRKFLLRNVANLKLFNFNDKVFQDANVDTCLLFFEKDKDNNFEFGEWNIKESHTQETLKIYPKIDKQIIKSPKFYLPISKLKNVQFFPLLNKIEENGQLLKQIAQVSTGIKAYQIGKGKPKQTKQIRDERLYHSFEKKDENYWKYLEGRDVCRYNLFWNRKEFIKYGIHLAEPRFSVDFSIPRILVRQIPNQPPYCFHATYTEGKFINDINSMIIMKPSPGYNLKFFLGVINSKAISTWFYYTFDKFSRKIFPQFKVKELGSFPIPSATSEQQKQIIDLVSQMLDLKKKLAESSLPQEKDVLQRQIETTDSQIDQLVYKLYDLTKEEIKIVESGG